MLRDVEYFAAIAEHGQVQRAAEALGLSQPALSISLRRLEQSMQTKLLKRTPQGVELTSVGKALLARFGKLRLSVEDVTREVADLSSARMGHLRIGMVAGSSLHLVPTACETLLKDAPGVTFKLTVGDTNAMLMGVRNGEFDLAISVLHASHYEDLTVEFSHDDTFSIYASASHRLAKRKALTLADLAKERWVLADANSQSAQRLRQAFSDAGLPPPTLVIETTNPSLRHHLVAGSDLLALSSTLAVRYVAPRFDIVELRVKGLALSRRAGVIYRKDAYLPPVAFRFIEILKATAKEITRENR